MVVRNSLLTAVCVAGLLSVASVAPSFAAVANNLIITNVGLSGTMLTVKGNILVQSGQAITSGITIDSSANLTNLFLYNAVGQTSDLFDVTLSTWTVTDLSQPFGAQLSFGTDGPAFANSASASFSDQSVSTVPEPGTIAFGVIAAGSVLGLVARKRKA